MSEQNADDILDVMRALEQVDYARRLTLFYKCHNYICTGRDRVQLRADGDEIGFAVPTARETNIARVPLEHIAHDTGHEVQVHYHHEYFTSNDKYSKGLTAARDFFERRNTPELDRKRWDVGLSLALETIRLEARLDLDRWLFVHGMWALNGSDSEVCSITDEIARLQRLGCLGDFSFPAGRVHCDPRYLEPVFVRPVDAPKGYDLLQADAVPAYGNGAAAKAGKFFIWSSAIKAKGCSIDYFSNEVRQRLEDIDVWLDDIVNLSVLKDETLFVKTHAHSMYIDYFAAARRPIPPHLHPRVQNLFCALFDGAADAGVEVEFATAGEVYRRFTEASVDELPARPATGEAPLSVASPVPVAAGPEDEPGGSDLADEVNRLAIAAMRHRIASVGEVVAGTGPYYNTLIERGRLLQQYEKDVAAYLIEHLSPGQPVAEIRAGLGMLTLFLAANGCGAWAVDADARRLDSFVAIREMIGERIPRAKANCQALAGLFSQSLDGELPRNAVLVFGNTVCGLDLEQQLAVIAVASGFAWVLFDAERFFVKRGPEQVQELLDLFVDAGFERPRKVLDLREMGQYYRADAPGAA